MKTMVPVLATVRDREAFASRDQSTPRIPRTSRTWLMRKAVKPPMRSRPYNAMSASQAAGAGRVGAA